MNRYEGDPMTDKQADTNRNDLVDLIIEKVLRIFADTERAQDLIKELKDLKH